MQTYLEKLNTLDTLRRIFLTVKLFATLLASITLDAYAHSSGEVMVLMTRSKSKRHQASNLMPLAFTS